MPFGFAGGQAGGVQGFRFLICPNTQPPRGQKARETGTVIIKDGCSRFLRLYFCAVFKLKTKEIFSSQSCCHLFHLFHRKGAPFQLLIKVGRCCSHFTGKGCLANSLIGQCHTYFLFHCQFPSPLGYYSTVQTVKQSLNTIH